MKCPNSGTKFITGLIGHDIFNIPTMQFCFGIPHNPLSKFILQVIYNIIYHIMTSLTYSAVKTLK